VSGSTSWTYDDEAFAGADRAQIDGFEQSADENHYLVSPAFNFTSQTNLTIEFNYGEFGEGPDIELLYSTTYTGSGDPEASGVVWTPISVTFTDNSTSAFSNSSSGIIALPATLEGQTDVYFAFQYVGDASITDGAEAWYIDDIIVDATLTASPLDDYLASRSLTAGDLELDVNDNGFTVLEEYLSGFGDGVGLDVIEYGIDLDPSLALTLTNGTEVIPEGITVTLLATNDLNVAFASVGYTHSVVDNLDGTFTHSYTETTPPTSDTRFLQLSITAD
jgi:hypothetical protein